MGNIYIATTTLNFNNILSTESISPILIYEKRKFGYKRLEGVQPNNFDEIIIAYSKPPLFSIPDEGLDSYPLVIELSIDLVKDIENLGNYQDVDIFKISRTIYLHPNKVKFFFLNEEHKKTTLIKSESSIETKLIPLYFNKFDILDKDDCFMWDDSCLVHFKEEEFKNIQLSDVVFTDKQVNSIKGFYYSYILGELYSRLEFDKNIYNAIMKNDIARNDALKSKNYKKIFEINDAENKILEKMHSDIINHFKDISIANNRITSIGENKQAILYKNILNDVSQYSINNENDFKSEKFELLKTIGDNFKEWEDISNDEKSLIIDYIRSLLKNIKNYEPFDIDAIEKSRFYVLLKSIAIFILKGDDLEKLLNSLIENDLKTFKIAFGLWGATFGFSAIPKTLSNSLFESDLKNIINVEDFLNTIYKEIHSIDNTDPITIQKQSKQISVPITPKPLSKNTEQKNQEIPKCPKCGSEMILKEPKAGGKQFPKGYGCSNWKPDKSGCDGWVDFKEYHTIESNIPKEKQSLGTKITTAVKSLFDSGETSNNDIVYDYLKGSCGTKISEVKKVLHCKTNNDFIELIKNDSRFVLYKGTRNTDMIKLKDS